MPVRKNKRQNKRDQTRIVACGDIHGDLLALVVVLRLSGCVELQKQEASQRTLKNTKKKPEKAPAQPELALEEERWDAWCSYLVQEQSQRLDSKLIWERWAGRLAWRTEVAPTELVILGDVMDSRRPSSDRAQPAGSEDRAQPAGSEELIVDIFYHLRTQTKTYGHQLTWILGNHDLANVTNYPWCDDYSHEVYCSADGRYTPERVLWAKQAVEDLAATAVELRDGALLFCHGGVSSKFLTQLDDAPGRSATPQELVSKINRLYSECVRTGKRPKPIRAKHDPPDWCRQGCVSTNTKTCRPDARVDTCALRRFGCQAVVVGHSIAHSRENGCTPHRRQTREGRTQVKPVGPHWHRVQEHQLYFLDVAMSRAFGAEGGTKTYACLELTKTEPGGQWLARTLGTELQVGG